MRWWPAADIYRPSIQDTSSTTCRSILYHALLTTSYTHNLCFCTIYFVVITAKVTTSHDAPSHDTARRASQDVGAKQDVAPKLPDHDDAPHVTPKLPDDDEASHINPKLPDLDDASPSVDDTESESKCDNSGVDQSQTMADDSDKGNVRLVCIHNVQCFINKDTQQTVKKMHFKVNLLLKMCKCRYRFEGNVTVMYDGVNNFASVIFQAA